jgi:hypothetical protein
MKHRDIKIVATFADKSVRFYADGVLKFTDTYKYGDHAVAAAHALAEQYAHHEPDVTLDMSGLL